MILDPLIKRLAPHELQVTWTAHPFRGTSNREYRDSPSNWEALFKRIADREVGYIYLWARPPDSVDDASVAEGLDMHWILIDRSTPAAASRFTVSSLFSRNLGTPNPPTQQRWVAFAKEIASIVDAVAGYITHDFADIYQSPYENRIGRTGSVGLSQSDRWARGYYWGTLLGPEQVRVLGGPEVVLAQAPAVHAQVIAGESGPSVFIQLSPDATTVSTSELRALREFLTPVLPTGDPNSVFIGPRYRLAED
jgi:hypothetical protein